MEEQNHEYARSKYEELDEFIRSHTESYYQRSADWYRVRYFSFGGSELANLMGLGKKQYMSYDEFFSEKFNSQQGTGRFIYKNYQMIMDWGTLFEPVHRRALEEVLGAYIVEASMCKGSGILKGCHYSPDGLSVVRTDKFLEHVYTGEVLDRRVFDYPYLTVLFEYKSPYMRKIVPYSVPENYIGQIKLGLSMFTLCDIACYSESLFRICTFRQWATKTYNPYILLQRKQEVPDPEPQYVGMCVFDELGKQSMGIESGDLSGVMSQAHFMKLMELQRMNSCGFEIQMFKFGEVGRAREKVKELAREGKAFFCWKLINMQHTAVERSRGFENVVAMYVNLGNKALTRFSDYQTTPANEMRYIKEFTREVKAMGLPLVPGNHQDAWFVKYEQQLITLYEKYLLDDWQSFYVLLTLLSRSQNHELRQRATDFAERARVACAEDYTKKELLEHLLADIYGLQRQLEPQAPQILQVMPLMEELEGMEGISSGY